MLATILLACRAARNANRSRRRATLVPGARQEAREGFEPGRAGAGRRECWGEPKRGLCVAGWLNGWCWLAFSYRPRQHAFNLIHWTQGAGPTNAPVCVSPGRVAGPFSWSWRTRRQLQWAGRRAPPGQAPAASPWRRAEALASEVGGTNLAGEGAQAPPLDRPSAQTAALEHGNQRDCNKN